MWNFPQTSQAIRQRLRRYERLLTKEKRDLGQFSDGSGKRYFLGPFYMLLGDVPDALRSYRWFQQEFPDDVGEPGQYLCWVLAHYRDGDLKSAVRRFLHTDLLNLYLFPRLFGCQQEQRQMWHGSNWQELDYVQEIPEQYFALWTAEEIRWAKEVYGHPTIEALRRRFVEIQEELGREKDRERRRILIEEEHRLASASLSGVAGA